MLRHLLRIDLTNPNLTLGLHKIVAYSMFAFTVDAADIHPHPPYHHQDGPCPLYLQVGSARICEPPDASYGRGLRQITLSYNTFLPFIIQLFNDCSLFCHLVFRVFLVEPIFSGRVDFWVFGAEPTQTDPKEMCNSFMRQLYFV